MAINKTVINMGGGGMAIGAGAIASGAGGDITITRSETPQALSNEALAEFLSALGEVKAALIGASVADGAALAGELAALEQRALQTGGALDAEAARRLLARVRFIGAAKGAVVAATARANAPIRRRAPPDVFISYKQEERARMAPLAALLRAMKVDVWFDEKLTPGVSFTEAICEEIDACRVQIVCWSPSALASEWVRGEAEIGRQRGVLSCVMIERCRLLPPFNMHHCVDLSDWRGEPEHRGLQALLHDLGDRLARPGLAALAIALAKGAPAINAWAARHGDDPFLSIVR